MRGLFFKVFIIFWIAQSAIFVISTALILRHRFDGPGVVFDAWDSNLLNQAKENLNLFEGGGCTALHNYGNAHGQSITLRDTSGRDVCNAASVPVHLPKPRGHRGVVGQQLGQQYVWSVFISSSSGTPYVFQLSMPHTPPPVNWYQDLLRFSTPQLPVAIVVGGIMTFVLVLLVTRPVVRLRKAARGLAQGDLSTRVAAPSSQGLIFEGDEIQALVKDFNHMAERLESLVGAQQLLLRDVSHELRSPLARLSVALELAREDASPAMQSHLERIEREAEKLNQLIGQLLTLSSLEAIEDVKNLVPISLNRLIEQMIPDAQFEARQRESSVMFSASEECVILGNKELLHRAIENIVRNAIRYTEVGTTVEIKLNSVQEQGRGAIVLEVSDHGPGIPANELNAIFRPFYRVDRARSSHTGGFGVGLAIAERAVKLHNGELRAFNRAEGGATMQMRFPAAESGGRKQSLKTMNQVS